MKTSNLAMPPAGRVARGIAAFLLAGLLAGITPGGAEPPARTLRILGRTPLPTARSVARDIRWASAESVYISHAVDGVFEVGLDGTRKRVLVPSMGHVRFGQLPVQPYGCLAVSDSVLAVASMSFSIAWRPLKSAPGQLFPLEIRPFTQTEAMDLQGDRVLLLGMRENVYLPEVHPNGEVAWLGTLSSGLKDLKPVLYDRSGPRMPTYCHCRVMAIGAARFLADGSFVIVPGFEKGVHLFSAAGRLLRSWKSEEVGLDTECSVITAEEEEELGQKPAAWQRWLNDHRTVDSILPLPQGPGLLVRSWGEDGEVHWLLKVLSATRVETYTVPITGRRPTDRLRGDVRAGRIAFLLSAAGFNGPPSSSDPKGEIVLAEIPN
ncbi:MAG TPA: hypothetical protein VHQ90_23705 [Thermoanaerobaculia bacterium]|nr:hypothetical protein [Thermoanaerobaculia bacterium]